MMTPNAMKTTSTKMSSMLIGNFQRLATRNITNAAKKNPARYASPYQRTSTGPMENAMGLIA